MFDKLYAMTMGNCIYQGLAKELVPFMSDFGLPCPSYHNPADFRKSIWVSLIHYETKSSLLIVIKLQIFQNQKLIF